MWSFLQNVRQRHESLKNYVHTAFRYPLPRMGRAAMGFVYFLTPVVGGWYVMQWAISRAHNSIGEKGENLQVKDIQGIGSQHIGDDGESMRVGAGGWGGGVRLAESDEETQKRNKKMLMKFLKQKQKMAEQEDS